MRDIMQAPSQHQIITQLIQWRCGINQNSRSDKHRKVVDGVVPGADGAEDIAGDEEKGGPGVDPGYAPGLVVEGLVGVEGAGDEEEDGEGDGSAVVRGVPVEGAIDWWILASFSHKLWGFGDTDLYGRLPPFCCAKIKLST